MRRETDRAYLKRPNRGVPPPRFGLPPMAVLIITYKSHELVEMCLASLDQHMPELPVYVYENSGADYPGREELAARHPDVHWVLGPVNIGFAAAVNALAEHTPADADLLLLNPDARLLGPLTRTTELLQQPGVAAVAPMVLDDAAAGPAPWDNVIRRPTLARALVSATGYAPSLRGTPLSQLYASQPAESLSIDGYMAGCCLAVKRVVWNQIGGFDEEFFLYGEEADWQHRARAAGWRLLMADELMVEHGNPVPDPEARGPGATHGGDLSTIERLRNSDMLRANSALLLEHSDSALHADVYLASTTVLDRVQRSRREMRRSVISAHRRTDLPTIVITTNRLVYGGAERQKVLLASELDRRGYPVTIVCVQRFGPLITEIPPTVRVVRQPWWAPMLDIAPGPALLISGDTNTETGFATLWRAADVDRRWLVAPHVPPEEDRRTYSRPLAAAMSRADGFIVLAQRHWEMMRARNKVSGRHFIAPNGVPAPGAPIRPVRAAGEPPHLVMLSRIVEHKNPQLLIEALHGLSHLPWKLSIFGDGPDREWLQAATPAELGDRVQWRGWSEGPGPALADADLLCVPSRSEAFPMAIIEAMARAVPVAASAVCAIPEMLDFGSAGFVVEPITVSAWRDQLAGILADPAALPAMGQRGYDRMRGHYTVGAMTDAYVDAIEAVL
jgi:glycosyltransferase involved in cell wall biosynthesis/GT2 family glycosyltransferase